MKRIFLALLLILQISKAQQWYEKHPLWAGYANTDFPRTPGLQGKIDKAFIKKYIGSDAAVIIEAGAHNGTDTGEFLQFWPNAKVYAFEPVPHLFAKLKNKFQSCSNIILSAKALSDSNKACDIFISSGESDGSSSLLEPKDHIVLHPKVKFSSRVKVECIMLEDFVKQNHIEEIDLLWLDLQGMEPAVLFASQSILSKVKLIFTEVNFRETYKNCIKYHDFKTKMKELGFDVVREDTPWVDGGNVLFARRDLFAQTN